MIGYSNKGYLEKDSLDSYTYNELIQALKEYKEAFKRCNPENRGEIVYSITQITEKLRELDDILEDPKEVLDWSTIISYAILYALTLYILLMVMYSMFTR